MKVAIHFCLLGNVPNHSADQTMLDQIILTGLGRTQRDMLPMCSETTLGALRKQFGDETLCSGLPGELRVWHYDTDTDGEGEGFQFTLAELDDLVKLA